VSAPQQVTIRYQAANEQGDTATGKVRVSVLPVRQRTNQPPEPPVLEGRTVSGDTVKLRLPGYGVDPDGDAVSILGLDSAPTLGRVTRIGANSIEYTAYPNGGGTDEFTYSITDTLGAKSTGTARVSITPPGPPQPPLAIADSITVAPGRTAVVDVLANDLVAAGSRVAITLVDPPAGVRVRSETGPVEVDAPDTVDGRSVEVVYRINDGLDSSQTTLTLRTQKGYNNPPVVSDAFGTAGDGRTITADVLSAGPVIDGSTTGSTSGAYDPDGPFEDLRVAEVYAPEGIAASVSGGRISVERAEQPMVVPFQVEDADGGAATGSLYVPAANSGLPFVLPDALIKLKPGQRLNADLADYVVSPSGGPVSFTLKNRVWASPLTKVNAAITDDGTFRVEAAASYAGPGAVVFEVTTGSSIDDPDGIKATLSVPVQVGETRPILRCPEEPIEVPQAESRRIDAAALCHVWTADPDQVGGLTWSAAFDDESAAGLQVGTTEGSVVEVMASAGAAPGDTGTLRVAADDSNPGKIRIRVVQTPPPSLAPIRISTIKAGESRTIDLARYLTPGVSNPVPTVVAASQLTDLAVQISSSGSSVTIRTGAQVHGQAEFRVVMSDVAGEAGPDRRVEGRIALDILGVPDVPGTPVPTKQYLNSKVPLDWRAPNSNGAPIDFYEVRDQFGGNYRCPRNSCDITGLENGTTYKFQVRAHNAVGFSDWSRPSAGATPDEDIALGGKIRLVEAGDHYLHIAWKPVETKGGAEITYIVKYAGGSETSLDSNIVISGLDNNKKYKFTVVPRNGFIPGGSLTSDAFQPVGPPGTPAPPTVTNQETAGSVGAVSLTWPDVDPNGPREVRYTVFRDGSKLVACSGIVNNACDVSGMAYDGHVYSFTVQATNKSGAGAVSLMGPPAQWRAVGKPASWSAWSLLPTGNNNEAKASFTVPSSRGAESSVRVYVDGAKVQQFAGTGQESATFNVTNNLGPHAVTLEVCNEGGACTQSSTQPVQTYGPIAPANIHAVTPVIGGPDGRVITWSIEVDSNGDPATVTVTSDQGRQEEFQVPVGVSTVTTQPREFGYQTTETVTVTLADASPDRGSATATNSATTSPPPPPSVSIAIGAKCNDSPGSTIQPCNTGGNPLDNCGDDSCAFIVLALANWVDAPDCHFEATFDVVHGGTNLKDVPNGQIQTDAYYGRPGQQVRAVCQSTQGVFASPWIFWQ